MVLRIRLNNQDFYSASPTELDPALPLVSTAVGVPDVPIIRVFGTNSDGEQVLCHVHGALPYIYVDYPGPYRVHGPDPSFTPEAVQKCVARLRHSIDVALNASLARGRGRPNEQPEQKKKAPQYVASIALCKGTPFYGYHVGWRLYCKIYLYSPRHISTLCKLLTSGVIMKRRFMPFEGHIGYLHQWMMDFGLYGCGELEVDEKDVRYRRVYQPESDTESDSEPDSEGEWGARIEEAKPKREVPHGSMLREQDFPEQSHSGWEIDIRTHDILNRHSISSRPLHGDFDERYKPYNPDEKLLGSLDELWRLHGSHMRGNGGDSFTASESRETQTDWLQEAEYRGYVEKLMNDEKRARGEVKAEDIQFTVPAAEHIPTAFETVDYLAEYYPKRGMRTQAPIRPVSTEMGEMEDVEVDLEAMQEMGEEKEVGEEDDYFGTDDEEWDDSPEMEEQDPRATEPPDKSEDNLDPAENRRMQEENTRVLDDVPGTPNARSGNVNISFDIEDFGSTPDGELQFSPVQKLGKREHTQSPGYTPSTKRAKVEIGIETEVYREFKKEETDSAGLRSLKTPKTPAGEEGEKSPQSILRKPGTWSFSSFDGLESTVADSRQTSEPRSARTVRFSQHTDSRKPSMSARSTGRPDPISSSQSTVSTSSLPTTSASSDISEAAIVGRNYRAAYHIRPETKVMFLGGPPPTHTEALTSLSESGGVSYKPAHFSNPADVPENPLEYGGVAYKPTALSVSTLPPFDPMDEGRTSPPPGELPRKLRMWEYAISPPTYEEMEEWLKENPLLVGAEAEDGGRRRAAMQKAGKEGGIVASSQIEGPTQKNRYGFKYSQTKKTHAKIAGDMTIMSLEIHVNTRGALVPDPEKDAVQCLFWRIHTAGGGEEIDAGVVIYGGLEFDDRRLRRSCNVEVRAERSETDLINALVDVVREWDPDILCGYEVHASSWGYVIERAQKLNGMQLTEELSRVKQHGRGRIGKDVDKWGYNKAAAIKVTGRHFVNIWRAMRGELALTGYKLENVVFHLLNKRIPHYSYRDLTKWYKSGVPYQLSKVLRYFILRTKLDLEILEKQEYVTRISEQARLIGVDFYSVFSRGSQLKVESLMFRIAKPESYMLMSPDKKQVARQNAIECKPLILEPQSAFYNSPVVVLDFQSLYPSVMIAYNYCYSTCLGRIAGWSKASKLGVTDYYRPAGLLEVCKDDINISPNGLVFVNSTFRKSLLAKMLTEILDTRVMVKSRMKHADVDKDLKKKLNSWQLALKLIANVTYGYTSATFSGRMPCVEIADAIVQTGRETLEKAIDLIHSESRWGAEVVYGDTDSLFVHLPGKTREEAFDIGEEIAARVTAVNPKPVKLKFEKVYHPSVLMAMKRYVGYKYEYREQTSPDFDAKGIETVRRDGTPAIQKIVEKSLSILFRTADLSQVKQYFINQCTKIMKEKVSIQDFCFAKEVKLGSYSENAPPQPGVKLAYERLARDPRNEPQYGERYPYVVVAGAPDQSVTERSVEVEWLLHSDALALDAGYYIRRKIIPPLSRIFSLVGANVMQWYEQMPKYQPLRKVVRGKSGGKQVEVKAATLELFMGQDTNVCPICQRRTKSGGGTVCGKCVERRDEALWEVRRKLAEVEAKERVLKKVCRSCAGASWAEEVPCDSIDCPVYYERVRQETKGRSQREAAEPIIRALEAPLKRRGEKSAAGKG